MQTSRKLTHIFLALFVLIACAAAALAQAPPTAGNTLPIPSDQKPGSMLFYNLYKSDAVSAKEDTRFNITNTHPTFPVNVHLFFVRKSDCTIADISFCLTANGTKSFLASEFDPGETGFLFVVATNANGTPINHNYLIGDEYLKGTFSNVYYEANLGAVAFSARKLYTGTPGSFIDWPEQASNPAFPVEDYTYSGGERAAIAYGDYYDVNNPATRHFLYDEVPNMLAFDNIQSTVDGNQTLMVVHSMQGRVDMAGGIGTLAGQVYNDVEKGFSYQIRDTSCLITELLRDSYPRTAPVLSRIIPSGRTGWLYFFSPQNTNSTIQNQGLLGVSLVANSKAATDKAAFNGGHNLHFTRTSPKNGFAIPVFMAGQCNNF